MVLDFVVFRVGDIDWWEYRVRGGVVISLGSIRLCWKGKIVLEVRLEGSWDFSW